MARHQPAALRPLPIPLALLACLLSAAPGRAAAPATQPAGGNDPRAIRVVETEDAVTIETDALSARIVKKGYVSGIAAGSFVDKRTGAKDVGFGLHIMDFLMAPGWRDDGYERDRRLHGDLPKHYVEGPQVCTQAKQLPVEVVRGDGFVAVRMRYTYHQPGAGYKAGSTWEQTLVFRPGVRYVLSAERIVSANAADHVFYRIDMPGHIRHTAGDTFEQVYLSYHKEPIPASALAVNFGPDERFLYQRKDDAIPERMIRAYQVKRDGRPGPWLAGMTLDPSLVYEAWCHQRGYVCFIQELHGRKTAAGAAIGAAYVVGWFDDVAEMQRVYDEHKGARGIRLREGRFELVRGEE